MRKCQWIVILALIGCAISFAGCEKIPTMMDPLLPDAEPAKMMEPPEVMEPEPTVGPVDVLIYTGATFWIKREDAIIEGEITKSRLEAAGFQAEITESDASVRDWMFQTTADGAVNVLIVYGVIPNAIYPAGNAQPDGSVAENWIETSDGNTILNQADYLGWSSNGDSPADVTNAIWNTNGRGALQNLMDNPNIWIDTSDSTEFSMLVTEDGSALTPSLVNFEANRPLSLNQLQGEWFAEKVFASDIGNANATLADPVIVRDGERGRLAIVLQEVFSGDEPMGEVAAEIIINYLLAE